MSELIQTGWGNVHMYRLTRDIYILNRYGIVFFFMHLFFYAFNVIDTAHMTYEIDCSSFGRKTIYDVQSSMQFTEQNNVWSGKYHELIAINSNIKLKLIREARKTEAPLKKKK